MINLFFPNSQRVTRKHFWLATIGYIAITMAVALVFKLLSVFIPNESTEPGQFSVTGAAAVPYIVVGLGCAVFQLVSGLKIARRRFHDRGKSGWWILIPLVPLVGGVWYVVELGFLAGTPGPNRYGPAPGARLDAAPVGYSTAA